MEDHTIKELAALLSEAANTRMGLDDARRVIEAAKEKARQIGIPVVAAVVDEGGNLVALDRMDDSLLASLSIACSKAYTAAALKCSTQEAAKTILPGQPLYGLQMTHPGQFCIFGGGIPLFKNGRLAGAVGVSGGTVTQDVSIAAHASSRF